MFLVLIAVAAAVLIVLSNTGQPINSPINYTYKVINTYPHDNAAFTEGLLIDNGALYESTGGLDTSSLRRVDLQSGKVLQEYRLPSEFYGEGLAAVNGSLVQLTWLNNIGFVYDQQTF